MLRNRSRAAVSSKQALGSDRGSISAPTQDNTTTKPVSSFLGCRRFFEGFFTKVNGSAFDANLMSPISILDMKPMFHLDRHRPFGYGESNIQRSPMASGRKRPWDKLNSTGIGLALITFPDETPAGGQYKQVARMVTFTPNLKVQIPHDLLTSPADSQTRNSHVTTGSLTMAEMELSEEYTRVTSHGPVQTIKHIFNNCIVKSCNFAVGCSLTPAKTNKEFSPVNFLSRCYTCRKSLGHNKDIYIYRYTKRPHVKYATLGTLFSYRRSGSDLHIRIYAEARRRFVAKVAELKKW